MREFVLNLWNFPITAGFVLVWAAVWFMGKVTVLLWMETKRIKKSIKTTDEILAHLVTIRKGFESKAVKERSPHDEHCL